MNKKNNKKLSVAYKWDQILQAVDILMHNTAGQFYTQPERWGKVVAAVLFGGGINTTCSDSNAALRGSGNPPIKRMSGGERRPGEKRRRRGNRMDRKRKERGNKSVEQRSLFS